MRWILRGRDVPRGVPSRLLHPQSNSRESEETLHARALKLHGASEVPALADLDAETSRFRNDEWDNEEEEGAEPAEDYSPYWDE